MQYSPLMYTICLIAVAYFCWIINKEYNKIQMDMFIQRKTLESMGSEMESMQYMHSRIIKEIQSHKRSQTPLIKENPQVMQQHSTNQNPPTPNQQNEARKHRAQNQNNMNPQSTQIPTPAPVRTEPQRLSVIKEEPRQPVSISEEDVDNVNMASCEVDVQPF